MQCNALIEIAQADGENDVKRFFEEYPTMMHVSLVAVATYLQTSVSTYLFICLESKCAENKIPERKSISCHIPYQKWTSRLCMIPQFIIQVVSF